MKFAQDIILRPIITEKSMNLGAEKRYAFKVAKDATKPEIAKAVEELFDGVKVESVNTINRLGKVKRQGRTEGRRPSTKKAYITLTKDSKTIEAFDNMAQ